MSTPAAITLQIISPRSNSQEHPSSWTLPCCVLTEISPTLKLEKGVWISSRIAKELGIQQGDVVKFACVSSSETFEHAVGIINGNNDIPSDVIVHGSTSLGILKDSTAGLPSLWNETSGKPHGKAVLYFHGKTEPGRAAYGFYLEMATGRDLVRGQGYYSNKAGNFTSEDMAYKALLDALTWVSRVPLHKLDIVGDSEMVVQVCQSSLPSSSMETEERRECLKNIRALLDRMGLKKIQWKAVKTVDNGWAIQMADVAMKTQKHETSCDYENISAIDKKKDRSLSGKSDNDSEFNTRAVIAVLSVLVIGVALWRKRA